MGIRQSIFWQVNRIRVEMIRINGPYSQNAIEEVPFESRQEKKSPIHRNILRFLMIDEMLQMVNAYIMVKLMATY